MALSGDHRCFFFVDRGSDDSKRPSVFGEEVTVNAVADGSANRPQHIGREVPMDDLSAYSAPTWPRRSAFQRRRFGVLDEGANSLSRRALPSQLSLMAIPGVRKLQYGPHESAI